MQGNYYNEKIFHMLKEFKGRKSIYGEPKDENDMKALYKLQRDIESKSLVFKEESIFNESPDFN